VVFHWGGLTGFPGYVSQVQVKYTLFTTSGVPIRAVCQVTMEEITGETPGQNPTSGSLHARRVHRVQTGDTLPHLAWQEYGDPTAWRVIAEANGIDDPMRLAGGRELLLPALDELDRLQSAPHGPQPLREAGREALPGRPGNPALPSGVPPRYSGAALGTGTAGR
jgi:hypothetical protein